MKDILKHKNIMYILIILILYTIIALLFSKSKFNKEEIKTVSNYSIFYTLSNSANMYVSYLGLEDKESVYKIVNDEYKTNNDITKENIISKLKTFKTSFPTYRITEMLEEKYSSNIKRYYIKGNIIDTDEDTFSFEDEYYLIMDVDSNNNTYQVTPYDGAIFKGEKNE